MAEQKTESLAGGKFLSTTINFFHFFLMNNQFHTERDNRVKSLACKTFPQWIRAFRPRSLGNVYNYFSYTML